MKNTILSLIVIISFSTFIYSQVKQVDIPEYRNINNSTFSSGNGKAPNFLIDPSSKQPTLLEDIDGSPYLNEKYLSGALVNAKSGTQTNAYLRYNIFNDEILIKNENYETAPVSLFLKNTDVFAKFDNKEFHVKNIKDDDNNEAKRFVQLLKKYDKFAIYKRYYQNLRPLKKARTSFEKDTPPTLKNYEQYYIEKDGEIKTLEMHRKKIVDAFPNHYSELKTFIKKENLRFNDEADLIILGDYYNSLD